PGAPDLLREAAPTARGPPAQHAPGPGAARARRCAGTPEGMTDASEFLPERLSLKALRQAAACCRGCDLYGPATQTVFGEGPKRARLMFVGEVPGDREDREGHP